MQANDERDQALENLANGKAPKAKRGGMTKAKATGNIAATGQERHGAASKLAQSDAVKDLAAYGKTYTQTFQAGLAAFNQVATDQLESLIDSEFEALDPSEEAFDFFGQMFEGFVEPT